MSAAKILLVDDELPIVQVASAYLESAGYEVITAMNGSSGLHAALTLHPDVVILDVMLPELGGIEVLANLRRESSAYVIMLTARSDEDDKLVALGTGADDYVTKPYSPRELVARVEAALRRLEPGRNLPTEDVLAFRHLRIDPTAREVWAGERQVTLTSTEFTLLWVLANHPGRVLTREQLLEQVWGHDFYGDIRVVDVHIGHVRRKLGDGFDAIRTVRGVGYRFEDERR
ncbi:MAG: winged helix-turn-helix domain-containing protein [Anaerolineae bacterium]